MNLSISKLSDFGENLQKRDTIKRGLLPGYHDTIQIVDVETESTNISRNFNYKELDGSYICLKHVRPELFIRRDFIKDFILGGKVFLVQDKNCPRAINLNDNYNMIIKNNILYLILSGHQYRRFGLIGQKIGKNKKSDCYEVKLDLQDGRIMRSNKFHDKLVLALRRLNAVAKVYLRWCPNDNNVSKPDELTLNYFNHVIEEYKLDGFKPIPLEFCFKVEQKLERTWINRSQVHPALSMEKLSKEISNLKKNSDKSKEENNETFAKLTDIVDWLGYQLLSLDCNQGGTVCNNNSAFDNEKCEPYNVYCSQISGIYDCDLLETKLKKLLERGRQEKNDSAIFRALFLYNRNLNDSNNDQVSILLQDYSVSSSMTPLSQPNDIFKCNEQDYADDLITILELTCKST